MSGERVLTSFTKFRIEVMVVHRLKLRMDNDFVSEFEGEKVEKRGVIVRINISCEPLISGN